MYVGHDCHRRTVMLLSIDLVSRASMANTIWGSGGGPSRLDAGAGDMDVEGVPGVTLAPLEWLVRYGFHFH
jgi:hypothetical protein